MVMINPLHVDTGDIFNEKQLFSKTTFSRKSGNIYILANVFKCMRLK